LTKSVQLVKFITMMNFGDTVKLREVSKTQTTKS
jgi:hypothetical protein